MPMAPQMPLQMKLSPHILTREAKEKIFNVLLGEVMDAAAQPRCGGAEHRPQGAEAAWRRGEQRSIT